MEFNKPIKIIHAGKVTHYYPHLGVAAVKVEYPVAKGDHIVIAGRSTNFEEDVDSMEFEHHKIKEAHIGEEVGIKVHEKAREGDEVYKVEELHAA
ncbi:MAG: hypothetical protein R3251_00950 [Candidatus Spechtbacterales bacterium]|nr:hypothetical protein [Candidatus Spechtbacterales bacterium]